MCSAESGGGLYSAGALEVSNTVFSENIAGEGGLAIHDEGSFIVMENVTFDDNKFSCPDDQYTDVQHVSGLFCNVFFTPKNAILTTRVDDWYILY